MAFLAMHEAAVEEAQRPEGKTCDASIRAAKKFSAVRATNLEELILKVRHADVEIIDDVVALSCRFREGIEP
jgi:hypothetical protein